MKKYLPFVVVMTATSATANAQSMRPLDVEGQLSDLFIQIGFGSFTLEKYLLLVAIGLASMFAIPYVLARLNGAKGRQAAWLGLQGFYGGLLFAGFITAPFGLILLGRAILKALDTPSSQPT